jgi:antitoxin FitA
MAAVTIRKISEETHRAIKARAKAKGRSAEAEMRAILEEAVRPEERIKLGTWLHERAMEFGGFDLEIERDQTPARFATFE